MTELRDLYQEVILDHNKRPRNFRPLEDAARRAEGFNPLCGDRVTVYLNLDGTEPEHLGEVTFEGAGCAISQASASLMTEALRGKSRDEAERLFNAFHALLTDDEAPEGDPDALLGKLQVFAGVRDYPMRVKCATLPWHTARAALADDTGGDSDPVTTE